MDPYHPFQLEMEKRREHQFEEMKGIANSPDFHMFTQKEFNKTWTHYEDETAEKMKAMNSRQGPRFSIRMVIGIFCSDTETGAVTPPGVMQKK